MVKQLDGGAWWGAVYGVAQSWTRLKRLSSSSSSKQLYVFEFDFFLWRLSVGYFRVSCIFAKQFCCFCCYC